MVTGQSWDVGNCVDVLETLIANKEAPILGK